MSKIENPEIKKLAEELAQAFNPSPINTFHQWRCPHCGHIESNSDLKMAQESYNNHISWCKMSRDTIYIYKGPPGEAYLCARNFDQPLRHYSTVNPDLATVNPTLPTW